MKIVQSFRDISWHSPLERTRINLKCINNIINNSQLTLLHRIKETRPWFMFNLPVYRNCIMLWTAPHQMNDAGIASAVGITCGRRVYTEQWLGCCVACVFHCVFMLIFENILNCGRSMDKNRKYLTTVWIYFFLIQCNWYILNTMTEHYLRHYTME